MANLIHFIQHEFDGIWNTQDIEAVMQRFAEEATVRTVPPLPGAPEQYVGKAQIRGFVQILLSNFHVNSKNFQQQGERVTWFATITSDSVRAMGVADMHAECAATVHDGKVTSFLANFTPDTLEKLAAAAAASK